MVQIAYQRRFQSSLIIILHRNENCHHVVVVSTQSKHIEMHQFPNSKSKNRKFLKPSPSSELLQQTKNPKKQKTEKKNQTQRFQCRSASCPPKVSLSISGNKPSKMASLIWSQGIRNPPKKGEEMTWGPPFKGSPSFSWSLIWGSLLREHIYIIDIYIYSICKYFVGNLLRDWFLNYHSQGHSMKLAVRNTGNIGCLKIRRFGGLYLLGGTGLEWNWHNCWQWKKFIAYTKFSHEKGCEIRKAYINNTICEIAWKLTSDVLHRTVLYIEKIVAFIAALYIPNQFYLKWPLGLQVSLANTRFKQHVSLTLSDIVPIGSMGLPYLPITVTNQLKVGNCTLL